MKFDKKLFEIIGDRLRLIRLECELSQQTLAAQTALTISIIYRIEKGKGGPIESLLILLNFYALKGYNLNWILTQDNESIFKKDDTMKFFTFPKKEIIDSSTIIFSEIKKLKKVLKEYDF